MVENHRGEKSLWWKVTVVKNHHDEKSLRCAAVNLLLIIVHCSNIFYCASPSRQAAGWVRIKSFTSICLILWSIRCREAFWLFGGTRCKEAGAPQVVTLTLDLALEQVSSHCQWLSTWNCFENLFKSKTYVWTTFNIKGVFFAFFMRPNLQACTQAIAETVSRLGGDISVDIFVLPRRWSSS